MPVDVTRDAPRSDLPPVDDSVQIPDSVRRAAALAESFYKPSEPPQNDSPPPQNDSLPPQNDSPPPQNDSLPPQGSNLAEPPPPPPPQEPTPQQQQQMTLEQQAEHRYLSMKGRYDQQVAINAGMQEQMQEMSNELMRTQTLLQQLTDGAPAPQQQPPQSLITPEDEEAFGPEVIDLARRAAAELVGPELQALRQQNARLQRGMQQSSQAKLKDALTEAIPNWREINVNPRFKQWLSLRNVYSRNIRSQELKAAYQAADAPTVIAFFKGFLDEEAATGHGGQGQQAPAGNAPRTPAVRLDTLAAPGKARPASGDPQVPVEKPVFTHAQIRRFYDDVRKGAYAGREADKQRDEKAIFDAQREGRIR